MRPGPKLSWAFPTDAHDLLLRAALLYDQVEGVRAAREWLATYDIESASFRDHRLLLAVIARYGTALSDDPAYPRLIGLQRMRWTRSSLAFHAACSVFRPLAERTIEVMLIKGAAMQDRAWASRSERAAHDVDFVVRPDRAVEVFDLLVSDGWNAASGRSPQFLRAQMPRPLGTNFLKANYGDIDLHVSPFHPGHGTPADDAAIWERAIRIKRQGIPFVIPGAEDAIAIAIAHGGLDGHAHSDWMVDCVRLIQNEPIDWLLLAAIIERRGVCVAARILFAYLSTRMGIAVPEAFLSRLAASTPRSTIAQLEEIVQACPKERFGRLGELLRFAAKYRRKKLAKAVTARSSGLTRLQCTRLLVWRRPIDGPLSTEAELPVPDDLTDQETLQIDALVACPAPDRPRRLEFEINAGPHHLVHFRHQVLLGAGSSVVLRVRGRIARSGVREMMKLEARPARFLPEGAEAAALARYDPVPFKLLKLRFRRPATLEP